MIDHADCTVYIRQHGLDRTRWGIYLPCLGDVQVMNCSAGVGIDELFDVRKYRNVELLEDGTIRASGMGVYCDIYACRGV